MSIRLTREDFNSYFGIFTRHVLITHSHSGIEEGERGRRRERERRGDTTFFTSLILLYISSDGRKDTKEVIMYQYAAWPDHGVPSDSSSIRHLINLVHNERYKSKEINSKKIEIIIQQRRIREKPF